MANEQNLKPFTSDQNREEAKKNGRKGGVKSGESRRRKRDMKKSLEALFATQAPDKMTKAFKKQGLDVPSQATFEDLLTISMAAKAIAGDARMVSLILDVTGDKHSDKLKEREIALKEKQMADAKSESLEKLDAILSGIQSQAEADIEPTTEEG